MDEARRFLRYIVPGLVYGAQTLVLLFVLDSRWAWNTVQTLSGETGLGVAGTILLASGGLGFIFSAIHHGLHRVPALTAVDHRAMIEALRRELITVVDQPNDPTLASQIRPLEKKVSRDEAWVIVTSLWYQRTKTYKRIEAADPRTVSLTDAMHSLGTARVASVAAWFSALWIAPAFLTDEWRTFAVANALAMMLLFVFHTGYKRTGSLAQRLTASVLMDALRAGIEGNTSESKPITTHLEVVAAPPALPTSPPNAGALQG